MCDALEDSMPYQDIPGSVVEYVYSYDGYNKAIGSLWKESIINFLLTAARETERHTKDLTLKIALGKQVAIYLHDSFYYAYAGGKPGQEWPTFEPEETLYSGSRSGDMRSNLFAFVHGSRRMLVITFAVSGPGFIDKLYLWKSPKDRVLHAAASYR